jgi:hypothetical protein
MPAIDLALWDALALATALTALAAAMIVHRRGFRRAALAEIDTLRFGGYVALVQRTLASHGYAAESNRGTSAAGYELDARRCGARFLVACKLGASTRLSARQVRALGQDVATQGANGAIVYTTGGVDRDARLLAPELGVEIVDGRAFWRAVRGTVVAEHRRAIRSRLRDDFLRHVRVTAVLGLLVVATAASAMAFVY